MHRKDAIARRRREEHSLNLAMGNSGKMRQKRMKKDHQQWKDEARRE